MKGLIIVFSMLLSIALLFSGCFSGIMVLPDNDDIGQPKTFEKNGIKLLLTDKFTEQKSEVGFDAYYVSNFCGVVVLKEEFSLEKGLRDRTLEEYVKNVIKNNDHTGIEPQNRDGLWFYVSDSNKTRRYSYCFKGSDAFYIVQYLCMISDAPQFEDLFFLWAGSVEVD